MKAKFFLLMMVLAVVFNACDNKDLFDVSDNGATFSCDAVKWNGSGDKDVAKEIGFTDSQKQNASGPKITSNAHSADFPGIYFIWDSKQKDNGYLKVSACVFEKFESFVLTSKESNKYFDFKISIQPEQETTSDNCYVFFIPKVYNNKNINMVFVSEFTERGIIKTEEPVIVNLGFIGYYLFEGEVLSTSIHWQNLEEGDCIDWDAVDVAYDAWVAQGGLEPKREEWLTSGYASFTFLDYAEKCFGDFNIGQLEDYYKAYYVDPGYILPEDYEFSVKGQFLITNYSYYGSTFAALINGTVINYRTDLEYKFFVGENEKILGEGAGMNLWAYALKLAGPGQGEYEGCAAFNFKALMANETAAGYAEFCQAFTLTIKAYKGGKEIASTDLEVPALDLASAPTNVFNADNTTDVFTHLKNLSVNYPTP